jgi:RNA polymerase sigma-70 factor (ECF subfamily)
VVPPDLSPKSQPSDGLETTASLVQRAQTGDSDARESLARRFLAPLRRWTHGRLPPRARDLIDTDDLVQVSLLNALDHIEGFENRADGSFLAYLRRIVMNQIRSEIRRTGVIPDRDPLPADLAVEDRSPQEVAIGNQALERYEAALAILPSKQQEAVIMRLELDFTYEEVAAAAGYPSWNAARMAITRGLVALAEAMHEFRKVT